MDGRLVSGRTAGSVSPGTTRSRVSGRRPQRLPTPEASRSSYDRTDSDSQEEATADDVSVQKLLIRSPRERRAEHYAMSRDDAPYPRISHNHGLPQSPPYKAADNQRPSLPPLRTVLGDNAVSPPSTPNIYSAPLQPSPREPALMSTTYKPPSLYPNKKQRTDLVLEPVPPITSPSAFSSPGMPTGAFKPRTRAPFTSQRAGFPAPMMHSRPTESRQVGQFDNQQRAHTPLATYQYDASVNGGPPPATHTTTPQHFRTIGPVPAPISAETQFDRMRSANSPYRTREQYDAVASRPSSRRSSSSGYDALQDLNARHSKRFLQPPEMRYEIPVRAGFIERDKPSQVGPAESFQRLPMPDYPPGPYQGHPFFMPSHYDYQHSKSRKRSNLPKQSTEIMKTWFDQNISNPYPSEEQKAMFSNATGISMTQVSNWFINHRRRCPELRDKRDKTRSRDDDD